MKPLTWVEISKSALENNIKQFRELIGSETILCACIKANAYGHGLVQAARIFLESGTDWFSVNSLYEARELRKAGIDIPIFIVGYIPLSGIEEALSLDCRLVVYNYGTVKQIGETADLLNKTARVHVKLETGTNRQGISCDELLDFVKYIRKYKYIEIEGLATHFANIEDTTDHTFAKLQIQRFNKAVNDLESSSINIPIKHLANSAATILFPETYFQMVRVGISGYGMWPSNETFVSYKKERENSLKLVPALTWKARVAQVKTVPVGDYIGYGCTYRTSHVTKLAIIPIGYYDGYDRGVSGGYVLIHSKRAPIRGRICMNIIMVEVTDIPDVNVEDEAVLMGRSGDEVISAEVFAQWAGTINYEVTTRINDRIPRVVVE